MEKNELIRKTNIIPKIIGTIVLIIVIFISAGPLSSRQSSYTSENERGLQDRLTQKTAQIFIVWGITRGASGLISLLQSFEVGVTIGVAGSLNPLEFLAPVDNVLDKVSDVCLYAIGAVMIEKFLLALSGWLAFQIIIPVCMLLCILSLWIGKYKKSVIKIIAGFGIIGVSVFSAVPLSLELSSIIEKKVFEKEIDRKMNEINLKNSDIENMQGSIEIEKPASAAMKMVNSVKAFFTDARDLAASLVSDVLNYITMFIVTNIIIPLLTIIGLGFITKYIFNLLLTPNSKLT
ncbi:hypothetical protein FACS189476_07400 [Spirochaetia bacterium]|nr:hypothetical protein FACS189476_07400 [Spirochaetia bacterium]